MSRRRSWRWMAAAAGVLAVAAVEQAARPAATRWLAGPGEAAWIWAADPPREVSPHAFYLAQDFEVAEPPASAPLLVLGDEEYLLYLNGRRVGGNHYTDGASLDRYEVAPLLIPGPNRLVAEVRSGRGAGGFLLRLEDGGAGALAATDASWRVFREHRRGLLGGWLPLSEGEPPRVWGSPPTGHWGSPGEGPLRPLASSAASPAGTAEGSAPAVEPAEGGAPEWVASTGAPGGARLFDFGRPVAGFLGLRFGAGEAPPALFCVGLAAPPRCRAGSDGYVLAPGEAPAWQDPVVRRFRYAAVIGLGEGTTARVEAVDASRAAAFAAREEPLRGLLGVRPPYRPTPVEQEVARRLGSTGPAGDRPPLPLE